MNLEARRIDDTHRREEKGPEPLRCAINIREGGPPAAARIAESELC